MVLPFLFANFQVWTDFSKLCGPSTLTILNLLNKHSPWSLDLYSQEPCYWNSFLVTSQFGLCFNHLPSSSTTILCFINSYEIIFFRLLTLAPTVSVWWLSIQISHGPFQRFPLGRYHRLQAPDLGAVVMGPGSGSPAYINLDLLTW